MNKGKVYLVGAGPGDIELLTLKAKRLLEEADVVVYDALVGQSILAWISNDTKAIAVGKRAGDHSVPQEEINNILLQEALKGHVVVRLKGGDPFLFGRGGEELELLVEHHIPFEIVPGVTSSIAVPAYNGIPVTHRDFCSSLHIITGHKKAGQELDIDFNALVHTKGTLVFLMGISALKQICKGLIEQGMERDMPAAVLQKGTTARQKSIVATVSTLVSEVKKQGIETPAIIVVGKVCKLANTFHWQDSLPLSGVRVLVTRPKELISTMAKKLRVLGAEVLELPAIETISIRPNVLLQDALKQLNLFSWIAFTSPTGVGIFFDYLKEKKLDIRSLYGLKLAVIGEGTKKTLEGYGIYPDFMPEVYDGDSLGEGLSRICKKDEALLLPRAEKGNEKLVAALKEKGVRVWDIPTYQTKYAHHNVLKVEEEIKKGEIDCVVFTSASTVKGFEAALPHLDYRKVKAACIGKQTKAYAKSLHMETYMAKKATMEELVNLVVEMKKERRI